MSTAIVIVAAGKGVRAASDIPKQYRMLAGKTVLLRTLERFAAYSPLIVVINPDDRPLFEQAVAGFKNDIRIAEGGATRTASVKAGLEALANDAPNYVLIHDAARPFVSDTVIDDVIQTLSSVQACVPALPIVDAVKQLDGTAVYRGALRRVQTPQGFHYSDILTAYRALTDADSFADDIAVAQNAGLSIGFSQGEPSNIKLTYPHDFTQAEARMNNTLTLSGQGFDVHRIVKGDGMWICGIEIEGEFSLLGHSDADVGLHSVTDAIFGALALGDIGDHFPPSDERWAGASSDIFLKHAVNLTRAQDAQIVHADVTLICERPKIKPHREAMRARLAELLDLPLTRVSVKATTTEGLGFAGRKEGVAAQAIVTLSVPKL